MKEKTLTDYRYWGRREMILELAQRTGESWTEYMYWGERELIEALESTN